ncbi:hypothetical protein ONZ45_g10425 [Pleurotus djamor]|nr:hypothetical protein ONZ45_g10425 [Pleurotus djamor]
MHLSHCTAIFVFPLVAVLGLYTLYGQAILSGLVEDLRYGCSAPPTFLNAYGSLTTGIDTVDELCCALIAYFTMAVENQTSFTSMIYLLSNLAIPATIVLVDPRFASQDSVMSMLMGIMYQAISTCPTFCVYWLYRILYDLPSRQKPVPIVSNARAEAIVFGAMFGMIIPTVIMIASPTPIIVTLWQVFPVGVEILRRAYLRYFVSPRSRKHSQRGFTLFHDFFVFLFIMSWLIHGIIVYPIHTDWDALYTSIIPSFRHPARDAPVIERITHGVKWDSVMGLMTTYLGTIWISQSLSEAISIALWYATSTVLIGPGAAIAVALNNNFGTSERLSVTVPIISLMSTRAARVSLANLKPAPRSQHSQKRVGRGQGSGYGGTAGRGNNGQKSRAGPGPSASFEGGQTPITKRFPKRGFVNQNAKTWAPVNLDRLQHWIDQGRITSSPEKPITARELLLSGCVHDVHDGIKLLGDGAQHFKTPIYITPSRASQSAIKAIESVGGKVVCKFYNDLALRECVKGQTDKTEAAPTRREDIMWYGKYRNRGYLAPATLKTVGDLPWVQERWKALSKDLNVWRDQEYETKKR